MSGGGYIGKGALSNPPGELQPEWIPPEKTDELGIHFEGQVLSGEKSLEEILREDGVAATKRDSPVYASAEDYDPVLRWHCRL